MKPLNKVLFFVLIFLFASLLLSPIKPEKSFQKIFPEKSLKKDEILKREEDMYFVEISKKTNKKEKPIIKYERDERNPRKLSEEENYIIVHYGSDASYPNGYRTGGYLYDAIIKIMYNGNEYQSNSVLNIAAGTYIEIYISSTATNMGSYFSYETISTYGETNCDKIISIDLSHLKQSIVKFVTNFLYKCNGLQHLICLI